MPGWLDPADHALTIAAQKVRLIRAVTARNTVAELAQVEQSFAAGSPRAPALSYDPEPIAPELSRALLRLADFVQDKGLLGRLYAARARELSLEAEMIAAVGTPRITELARRRFLGDAVAEGEQRARSELAEADEVAMEWLLHGPSSDPDATARVRTCDSADPRSLLSCMRAEVGQRRLPVRVVVEPGLASLAATGDGVVFIAEGRYVAPEDVTRTVLHEIEGHVLPRVRAQSHHLGIFVVGTAHGVDDQEGRALLIERATGFLVPGRKRELGLRHWAARSTFDGADFVTVTRGLLGFGCAISDAVRIAARVQRGGPTTGGGLAREIVYLPAMLRVERALGTLGTGLERIMAHGKVSVDAAREVLEVCGEDAMIPTPNRPLAGHSCGAPEAAGETGHENW